MIALTQRGSEYGPYVRGRLALAGLDDSRVPAATYCDAIYAIVADAPHDTLKDLFKQLAIQGAAAAPDRESWGLLPEHQMLSGGMKPAEGQPVPRLPRGDRVTR